MSQIRINKVIAIQAPQSNSYDLSSCSCHYETEVFVSHHVTERANCYELFENVNKPLSPKYNCVAVFNNHAEIMIEIQHCGSFILFFDETHFLNYCPKLIEVQKVHSLRNQSLDNFFEVKPPEK